MRVLDLFAGIGGFTYAGQLLGGFTTLDFVEIDPYCQKVLRKNYPNVPIHDDITTFDTSFRFGDYDLITAGFPCQDLSIAGRQAGLQDGTRSALFYEVIRIARQVRPRFILFENVRHLLSHKDGETFQEVLFQIAKAGYNAEWGVVSAADVGACHKRERMWIIAYANDPRYHRPSKRQVDAQRQKAMQQRKIPQLEPTRQADITNSNGTRTQSNCSKKYKSIWTNAFINSSQRRTLGRDWTRYVSEPCLRRGDDGLRGRMDRLKSLGNSVSPPVAAIPLQRVHDLYYK